MIKQFSLLVLAGVFIGGCSQPPVTTSPQVRRQAAQSVVDAMTGNARRSRNKGRDLRSESDTLLAAKDYKGAMNKRMEILAQRPRSVSLLSTLSSYATESLALADLEKVASKLDAASCRRYAEQLKTIDSGKPTFSAILDAQEADELKMLARITRTPQEWQEAVAGLKFSAQEQATLKVMSAAQVKGNIQNVYSVLSTWAQQPYSADPAPISGDPYTTKFAVPRLLDLSRFLWAKSKAERGLVIAALQQRADRLEKRKRSWALPVDPFGNGSLKEKNGIIYSIGPDVKDDGGKPVPAPKRIQMSDTGDIVAPSF